MDHADSTFIPNANALALADALESGRFKQGRGVLMRRRVHPMNPGWQDAQEEDACCLGVACLVALERGLNVEVSFQHYTVAFNGETTIMPTAVRDYFGFATCDGEFVRTGRDNDCLLQVNDRPDSSFQQIAHMIRTDPTLYRRDHDGHSSLPE